MPMRLRSTATAALPATGCSAICTLLARRHSADQPCSSRAKTWALTPSTRSRMPSNGLIPCFTHAFWKGTAPHKPLRSAMPSAPTSPSAATAASSSTRDAPQWNDQGVATESCVTTADPRSARIAHRTYRESYPARRYDHAARLALPRTDHLAKSRALDR